MLLFFQIGAEVKAITILQAIQQKKAKVVINGVPEDDTAFRSSYYGKCLRMKITNISGSNTDYSLAAGTFIYPDDSSQQRMIVTNSEAFALLPGKSKTIGIFAMCSEMNDAAPNSSSLLAMGEMSGGNLLVLAQLIDKNNFISSAAQHAIWAITDNNDIASIYSENKEETNILRNFVCKALNKPLPSDEVVIDRSPRSSTSSSQKKNYSGKLVFKNFNPQNISMTVCDSMGRKLFDFFDKEHCGVSDRISIEYNFEYYDYPKGTYFVKIIAENKEVLVSQAIHLR